MFCGNKERFTRRCNSGNGFISIQLVIIVVIIGILIGGIFPFYQKSIEKKRIAQACDILKDIYGSQMRYSRRMNTYAKAASSLDLAPITNKHFTFKVRQENASPTNIYKNETLSTAVRNKKNLGLFTASYTIAITETGEIYSSNHGVID